MASNTLYYGDNLDILQRYVRDETAARTYQETVETGGSVAEAMIAFRRLLGTNDLLAYLSMMAPRLVELRRALKPTGSLYLHCDPTASHYLKILTTLNTSRPIFLVLTKPLDASFSRLR